MKTPVSLLLILIPLSLFSQKPEIVPQIGHSSQIFHLEYSPDGAHILSVSSDNTVNVWDAKTGLAIRNFAGHADVMTAAAYSPDGKWVAIAGLDDSTETIQFWNVETGEKGQKINNRGRKDGKPDQGILALAFSPDGTMIAAKAKQLLKVYKVSDARVLVNQKLKPGFLVINKNLLNCVVGFTPDNRQVVAEFRKVKSHPPYIGVWDINTGKMTYEVPVSGLTPGQQAKQNIKNAAATGRTQKPGEGAQESNVLTWYVLSDDAQYVAYLMGRKHGLALEFWNIKTKSKMSSVELGNTFGVVTKNFRKTVNKEDRHRFQIPAQFTPDGKYFAIGNGPDIQIYSTSSGMVYRELNYANLVRTSDAFIKRIESDGKVRVIDKSFESYSVLEFNEDGSIIVGGGGKLDATVEEGQKVPVQMLTFWNINTQREVLRIKGQHNRTRGLAFNSNGKEVYTAGNQIRAWDLSTGQSKRVKEKVKREFNSIAIGGRGTTLIASSRRSGYIFDLRTGKERSEIKLPVKAEYADIEVSNDGNSLVTDGTIYEIPSGAKLVSFQSGDAGRTFGASSFSPDGSLIAEGGKAYDLADAKTGEVKHEWKIKSSFHVPGFKSDTEPIFVAARNGGMEMYNGTTGSKMISFEDVPLDWTPGKRTDLVISNGGSYVATGRSTISSEVLVWNARTGKRIGKLPLSSREVTGVEFSPNSKIIATASRDAAVKLWKLPSCELAATMVPIDSTDFIITTPDNYYMATKGALDNVAFRVGDKAFPFEQFDLQLNRPDIVLNRIGLSSSQLINAYHKAYQKRLKRMQFTEDMFSDDFQIPEVKIESEVSLTSDKKNITFKMSANDERYNLDRINVYVNDVPEFGMNGKDLRGDNTKTWSGDIDLELSEGYNKVQVSTLNQKGVESLKETFYVNYEGVSPRPELYLITIGVSKYKDNRFDLKYAAKDANDLAAMLGTNPGFYGNIHQKSLTNDQASSEQVKALKSFLANAKVDDVVVIFVAGHGLLDADLNYYFGTYDTDFDNPSIGGLPYEELEALLDQIKPRKKLLIMDTCHSGEVDEDEVEVGGDAVKAEQGAIAFRSAGVGVRKTSFGLQNSFELMKHLFQDLRKGTGATVISSAGGAEYAMEGADWNNGVFTYCLLNGMKNKDADLNKDGEIMLSEIQEYAQEKVGEMTNGKQVPTSRLENLSNDFRVW